MTVTELLTIPPSQILSLSDAELAELISPLFPAARAPYIGKRSSKPVIVQSDGRKVSRAHADAKLAQLVNILKATGQIQE